MFKLFSGCVLLFLLAYLSSCRKDTFDTDSGIRLKFSTDTLFFDTVFTALGQSNNPRSVNRRFTVFNPSSQKIKTDIRLAGGTASPFRLNIDGQSKLAITDFEIRPKDSIYVFVEVTVDANNQSNPLIIQDSVLFSTNGNLQDVKLVAWGQDAYYFQDSVLGCNLVWDDKTKPYVIFNSILVPEGCKLTIKEGVKVHSSIDSRIYVAGTLEVLGTAAQPTQFLGARLGAAYEEVASQWWGIRLLPSSRNNIIRNAQIKNGVIGLQVDSLQPGFLPKLDISNTKILNMSFGGLICYTAKVNATNTLVANCGRYTFVGDLGGDYTLRHCTFANYGHTFSRNLPSFGLTNADYNDNVNPIIANNLRYNIQNSIIYGSFKDELILTSSGQGSIQGNIESSIIRSEISGLDVNNNIINQNPKFLDVVKNNFELDTLSPAKDRGALLIPAVTNDLKGELRDSKPDIGAFERKE